MIKPYHFAIQVTIRDIVKYYILASRIWLKNIFMLLINNKYHNNFIFILQYSYFKILLIALALVIICWSASGKSFNNSVKEKLNHEAFITYGNSTSNETYIDLYYGVILGWQTQQTIPGQCYKDTYNFYVTLNDTLNILFIAYLPTNCLKYYIMLLLL